MGLSTDLMNFFSKVDPHPTRKNTVVARSMMQFFDHQLKVGDKRVVQPHFVGKLVSEGMLMVMGTTQDPPPFNHQYYSNMRIESEFIEYGVYDFLVEGFPLIRSEFQHSVVPLEVIPAESKKANDIGSAFIVGPTVMLTALHCLPGQSEIRIPGLRESGCSVRHIIQPSDARRDICAIMYDPDPFPKSKKFRLMEAQVLESVMTMGYPPIPGFKSPLLCETAHIAGLLKSTTGEVISQEDNYLDGESYYLISARVKGGNSGGPVVNKMGFVIGMVTQNAENSGVMDWMGYGQAIPGGEILRFTREILEGSANLELREFLPTDCGFILP